MQKIILSLMLLVTSVQVQGSPESFIKRLSNGDPSNPALNLPAAAASGFFTYVLLRSIERRLLGVNDNKLAYLVNVAVSSLLPGLIWADANDDGELNGSSISNLIKALQGNKNGAKALFSILIENAGVTNVAASFVGALLADHIG